MKTVEVSYIKDPEQRKAYLVSQGPEVSVVRFIHNGVEQCLNNIYLIGLPTEKSK